MNAILEGIFSESVQAGGHRDPSLTDLRSDQEQEFQEKVQLGVRPVGRAGLCSLRDARRPSFGERL